MQEQLYGRKNMTDNEYEILKHLPLEIKILKTKLRIQEWVYFYGEDNVYISFSGGKDSTVLLHLVRQIFPNIKAVFVNTGLEYPEIVQFVKSTELVTIIKPKIGFREVIIKYGYPVVTKEQADFICRLRKNRNNLKIINQYLNGISPNGRETSFVISKKWRFLVDEAPFNVATL